MSNQPHPPAFWRFQDCYEPDPAAGRWLIEFLNRSRLLTEPAAASVEFASAGPAASRVREGAWAGAAWPELTARFGADLVGARGMELAEAGLVLEVKVVARENSDSPVMMVRGRSGATADPLGLGAAVVVLETRGAASVYYGRKRSLAEGSFVSELRRSPGPGALEEHAAEAGQAFTAPPGAPFALGRGALAYVVTARREDDPALVRHDRPVDPITTAVSGKKLFIAGIGFMEGMSAASWLLASARFATVRLDLRGPWQESARDRASFIALTALAGRALLTSAFETETIAAGQTVAVAASCESFKIIPGPEGASILKTWLPDHLLEIEKPLVHAGASQREIEGLYGFFGRT